MILRWIGVVIFEGDRNRLRCCWPILVFCFILGVVAPTFGHAEKLEKSLFIVTSFPENLFGRFKTAFEQKYPSVKVFIRNKKTSAAISFIQDRPNEPVDLIWASAPDAFEVLKDSGHLLRVFDVPKEGPARIHKYPMDDPEGFYRGFAISGYGILWNRDYLSRRGLPPPQRWEDLRKAIYYRHIGVSAPSRSGTTHLIVETLLQGKGWSDGWATLIEIGGNLATVTARSYGVVEGVKSGRFGAGIAIDFFGLAAKMTGFPVEFTYPPGTTFLPANIALVKRASNRKAAMAFVNFILSPAGQRILLEPKISRLPVLRAIYQLAPQSYPNPFNGNLSRKGIPFNSKLSRSRYHLVNSLFDIMITYRLKALNRTWKAIHDAESMLKAGDAAHLRQKLLKARRLASLVPLSKKKATNISFTSIFTRKKPGLSVPKRQIELEREWQEFARKNQSKAYRLAREVLDEFGSGKRGTE